MRSLNSFRSADPTDIMGYELLRSMTFCVRNVRAIDVIACLVAVNYGPGLCHPEFPISGRKCEFMSMYSLLKSVFFPWRYLEKSCIEYILFWFFSLYNIPTL